LANHWHDVQTSFENSHMASEIKLMIQEKKVNEKSGIPSILTLRTQMVNKTLKTTNNNIGIKTST
jgi:hypothetical protein